MKVLQITGIRFDGLGAEHRNISHLFGPSFGCMTKDEVMSDLELGTSSFWMTHAGWSSGGYVMVRIEPPGGASPPLRQIRTQSFTGYGDHLLGLPRR